MLILGIDPGIGRCGWGIIETQNSKLKTQNYGCIETSPKKSIEKRLEEIHSEISKIIKKYSPDVLSIEELFFNTNAKTAFVVGQARGVILLCASLNNLEVAIYTPLQVKMALTGYGRADKNQIGQMVKTLLKLKTIPKPDDAADALAVALTHAFLEKTSRLYK
ncbi:MAG: crossover junction endodeoxyribonuclease RuvC [Candidatus Levybacteria bacterium RBG_13_35_9]|nr:MAG: crossover junction endodeoxyribonuclease RuvC [Candidatus Levybacteria bacterium RBG_13_35_9]